MKDSKPKPQLAAVGKFMFASEVALALALLGLDKAGVLNLGTFRFGDSDVSVAFLVAVLMVLGGGATYLFLLGQQSKLDQEESRNRTTEAEPGTPD